MRRINKNDQLFLIGFMGAGKTTIGKLLAEKLNRPFIDIDDVIENQTHLTIPMIFTKFGEDEFRKIETDCLEHLSKKPGAVIATGGGVILSAKNRTIMRQTGISIYLKWHVDALYRRIKNSTHRPLLISIDESRLSQYIGMMLRQRQAYYEQADIIIDAAEPSTPGEIVDVIIQQLLLK